MHRGLFHSSFFFQLVLLQEQYFSSIKYLLINVKLLDLSLKYFRLSLMDKDVTTNFEWGITDDKLLNLKRVTPL